MRNPKRYDGVDLTGQRHGRLTAIRKADFGRTQWVCKCDCGKEITIPACKLFILKSCGCYEKENLKNIQQNKRTHGLSETRLYQTWRDIKNRCYNPNVSHYDRYGGRGIKMDDAWKDNFVAFAEWAVDNGFNLSSTAKEQSIDRIDPNGNYEPTNCRWATRLQQARNRSDTVYLMYNGERITMSEFCDRNSDIGITRVYAFRHIKKGQTGEEIITCWKNHQGK